MPVRVRLVTLILILWSATLVSGPRTIIETWQPASVWSDLVKKNWGDFYSAPTPSPLLQRLNYRFDLTKLQPGNRVFFPSVYEILPRQAMTLPLQQKDNPAIIDPRDYFWVWRQDLPKIAEAAGTALKNDSQQWQATCDRAPQCVGFVVTRRTPVPGGVFLIPAASFQELSGLALSSRINGAPDPRAIDVAVRELEFQIEQLRNRTDLTPLNP